MKNKSILTFVFCCIFGISYGQMTTVGNNTSTSTNVQVGGTLDVAFQKAARLPGAKIEFGQGRTVAGPALLDFIGDLTYTDFGLRFFRGGAADAPSTIEHRGTGSLALKATDAGSVTISTNGTERVLVDAAGNMGIGVSDPGTFKLAVEGTIGSREIKVQSTSFADFVFDEDYDLPSLDYVESYINENKHLPEIPSQQDVIDNEGYYLGEMNVKLLQKVEELTLYLIQQNKEIQELKEQVKELKK